MPCLLLTACAEKNSRPPQPKGDHMKPLKLALLSLAILGIAIWSQAQGTQTDPCANERSFSDVGAINACPTSNIPLTPNTFHATPLMDGTGGSYGDSDNNKVA